MRVNRYAISFFVLSVYSTRANMSHVSKRNNGAEFRRSLGYEEDESYQSYEVPYRCPTPPFYFSKQQPPRHDNHHSALHRPTLF